ncbi:MAG: RNA polymerase sigma-70 factor (ECF subfamily) [Pseudohongiellaceae bacterium]|jgi:RNA polymerase sigma-70 factor (ECF subfamily)
MLNQYEQTIKEQRQRIYSFAFYSLRAKEDAEDVTQEVFIKLWRHWQTIDHLKVGGWLMRVARNAVIDHVRKQKPALEGIDQYADVESQPSEAVDGQQIDQAKVKQGLMQAIRELDEPFKSILIMRDIQALSYSDIQMSLDISESQVKVYLHRARRKLRESTQLKKLFGAAVEKTEKAAAGSEL